jgi:hypothetical protein
MLRNSRNCAPVFAKTPLVFGVTTHMQLELPQLRRYRGKCMEPSFQKMYVKTRMAHPS